MKARCERGSIILISNNDFGKRGELLGDKVIALAVLGRSMHHSHVLSIRGESYWHKDKDHSGLFYLAAEPGTQLAGIQLSQEQWQSRCPTTSGSVLSRNK